LNQQLAELCDGARVDELEARLEVASARLNREAQLVLARKTVAPLLSLDTRTCPVCGLACDGAELSERVWEGIRQANSAHEQAAEEVQKLARRKEQAQGLAMQREAATRQAEIARREYEQLVAQIAEELGSSRHAWERSAEARLTALKGRLDDLQQDDKSATERSARYLQRTKALREEWRYHQLRNEEQRLRRELQEG